MNKVKSEELENGGLEIKTEVMDYMHVKVENLHHAIDIKEETTINEFSCEFCDFKCSVKENFKGHLATHSGEKPFECESCGFTCFLKQTLRRHIRSHVNKKRRRFVRIQPFHIDELQHVCTICDFKFSSRMALSCHLKFHSRKKPFKCTSCHYTSSTQAGLKNHFLLTHNIEEQFTCIICDFKCFKSESDDHLRTHTGEKPFECKLCNLRFFQNGDLRRHLRTHTGKKAFECALCDRTYLSKDSLKCHLKRCKAKLIQVPKFKI